MYCLCFTGHYSGISRVFCVFIGKILESLFLNNTSKKNYIWVNSSNHRRASESLFVNQFDEQIFRKHLLGVCNYTTLNSNMDFVVCFLVEQFWSHFTKIQVSEVKWVKITQLYPTLCNPVDYIVHEILQACPFSSEKAVAPHSSTLAWKIPWTEEPGRLQSMGSLRVGHDWATSLPCIEEGNGNPLQCSCVENPRDREALWAAVYRVAQSRTRLKWLSSMPSPVDLPDPGIKLGSPSLQADSLPTELSGKHKPKLAVM